MQEERGGGGTVWIVAGVAALLVALVWPVIDWAQIFGLPENPAALPPEGAQQTSGTLQPFVELLKLVTAAGIGLVVTAVHKRSRPGKALSRPLAHAQTLFCVAGALVIIIIGDSLPRAFGAFGVASIIRFRTPLKDPKEAAVLFLLVGLGMACGGGALAVAGLGTLFLCGFLVVLNRIGKEPEKPRYMVVEMVAAGGEFPSAHVEKVFAGSGIISEAREVSHGKEAVVKYRVALDPKVSLDELTSKLMQGGTSGIKSLTWEPGKKGG